MRASRARICGLPVRRVVVDEVGERLRGVEDDGDAMRGRRRVVAHDREIEARQRDQERGDRAYQFG